MRESIKRTRLDYPLLICAVLLVGLGLTMIFSTTAVLASEKFNDSYYFIKKSFLFAVIGFSCLTATLHFSYEKWKKIVYPLFGFTCLLMLLVTFTDFGVSAGGAKRWIDFGFFRGQPSELAKFSIILFLAYSLDKKTYSQLRTFSVGVLPHILVAGLLMILVILQRDLGTIAVIGLLVALLLFVSGVRIMHLLCITLTSLPFLYQLIAHEGYRLKRIVSFLNPWEDRYGSGFQVIQSYLAFNEGGLFGKGLGAGQQKLFYLPEAHSDFIFSVLGEELGMIGVAITIFLFAFFCYRGVLIGWRSPTLFGRLLALGITFTIGIQAIFNMGVVMGLLPTKGLVLPFVSYGGSSLVITLFSVGILLNISTYMRISSVSEKGKLKQEDKTRKRYEDNISLWGNRWNSLSRHSYR